MTEILTSLDVSAWIASQNNHESVLFTWRARQVWKGSRKLLQMESTLECRNDYSEMGDLV